MTENSLSHDSDETSARGTSRSLNGCDHDKLRRYADLFNGLAESKSYRMIQCYSRIFILQWTRWIVRAFAKWKGLSVQSAVIVHLSTWHLNILFLSPPVRFYDLVWCISSVYCSLTSIPNSNPFSMQPLPYPIAFCLFFQFFFFSRKKRIYTSISNRMNTLLILIDKFNYTCEFQSFSM